MSYSYKQQNRRPKAYSRQRTADIDADVPNIPVAGFMPPVGRSKNGLPDLPPGFGKDMSFSQCKSKRRGAGGRASIKRYGNAFLSRMQKKYAPLTLEALERRYNRMDRDFDMLYKQGYIGTLSPDRMTANDIYCYISYRRSLELSETEMMHDVAALTNLFRFIGNDAVDECLDRYPEIKPERQYVRLPSLTDIQCEMIFNAAMAVDQSDWKNMVAHAVPVFALATGMRSKELRLCNFRDIDCSRPNQWRAMVMHPKGEGKYGKPRPVAIDPEAYPFLERYFYARRDYIMRTGVFDEALFPGGQMEGGYLQSNTLRKYVDTVSKELGFDFDLRMCRRTYGQRLIDNGADINTVSRMMGHKTTVTTERCYCSLDQEDALNKAETVFETKMFDAESKRERGDDLLPHGFESKKNPPQSTPVDGGDS